MADDHEGASPVARRWLRTLRIVRRRVQASVPPPSRYLLVVTPVDAMSGIPLHVESGGDPWCLLDRGGEAARRRGVPCTMSVHDLEVADLDLGTVAWLPVDAEGHVVTRPPGADAPEGRADMSDPSVPTDAVHLDPEADELPVVAAGDPCPVCGGSIVVDGLRRYTGVPVHSDGTDTDEGDAGDFEWDGPAYCGDCGVRVRVEF